MQVNILIRFDNGKFTEMYKQFDNDKPHLLEDNTDFSITFFYDTNFYTKADVVDRYLKENGLNQLYGFFVNAAKTKLEKRRIKSKTIRDALAGIISSKNIRSSIEIVYKAYRGDLIHTQYAEFVLPDDLIYRNGYKVVCYSYKAVDFKRCKKDINVNISALIKNL